MAIKTKTGMGEAVKAVFWAGIIALGIRSFLFEPYHIPSDSMLPGLNVGDHLFVNKMAYGYSNRSMPFSPPVFGDRRILGRAPERGDVIVFKKTKWHEDNYIKRLIGLPGDRIQVRRGILHINGKAVERENAGRFFVLNLPMSRRGAKSIVIETNTGQTLTLVDGSRLYLSGRPLPRDEYTVAFKRHDYMGEVLELKRYIEVLPNGVRHQIIEYSDDVPMDNTAEYVVPEDHYFMMGDNRDFSEDSREMEKVGFIPFKDLMGRAGIIFYSHNNSVRFWELWKCWKPIRYHRLLNRIR